MPPSLAGKLKAILCLASSNLFLILFMLASGSFTDPKSSNKFFIGCMAAFSSMGSGCFPDIGGMNGFLFTFCKTAGDLSPSLELGLIAIGMCFTGIGIEPESVLSFCV